MDQDKEKSPTNTVKIEEAEIIKKNQTYDSKLGQKKANKNREKRFTTIFLAGCVFLSVFFGAIAGFFSSEISTKGLRGAIEGTSQSLNGDDSASDLGLGSPNLYSKVSVVEEESAVIDVVEKTAPAVVSIIITKDVPKLNGYSTNPFFNDPFFNPFGFSTPQQNVEPETEKQEIGGGTGFVVSSDGYIITNGHVVDDEDAEYTVVMNDGTKIEASVLARDTLMDLAVIKINKTKLDFVNMGDSDSLKIGQTVVAIGNSLGEFRNTVSKGIISGLKRNVNAGNGFGQSELLEEVIQTDAAINPGNSGGPIINLKGQAVGVNVAMAKGAENIGFAIPINEVKKVYQSVKETGRIIRPFLGVRYMIINDNVQQKNNLDVNYGAVIVRGSSANELAVVPNSPASKAGLIEGDIILEVNGKKIDQENDLAKTIKKLNVGDVVVLKVLSNDAERIVQVALESAD